jgi:endogenous inhibitor of DNA gyrase (YacG/DUF329 family)
VNNIKNINCPICGKTNTWRPENTYRPFCSDRCKLIDLGEWASETRNIPGESIDLNSSNDETLNLDGHSFTET